MSMPERRDLNIYQGDSWSAVVTFTGDPPPDLEDGYTVLAQVRTDVADKAEVVTTMNSVITGPQEVSLTLLPEQTATLAGEYRWDLQVASGGLVATVLAGDVHVTAEVSRP